MNSTSDRTLLQWWYSHTTTAMPGSANNAERVSSRLIAAGSTPNSTRLTGSHRMKPKFARPQAIPQVTNPQLMRAWRPRDSWRMPVTGCCSSMTGAPGWAGSSRSMADDVPA